MTYALRTRSDKVDVPFFCLAATNVAHDANVASDANVANVVSGAQKSSPLERVLSNED